MKNNLCRIFLVFLIFTSLSVNAKTPVIKIIIENHIFIPSEITVPANTKVKLLLINNDLSPEEFESYELNREKIILGKSKAVIFIGPLKPGSYPFFGEFNQKTAQGIVKAE